LAGFLSSVCRVYLSAQYVPITCRYSNQMISIGYERLDHIIQVLKEEYRKTSKWFLEYFQNSFTSPLDSRRQSG
jgi:hypothetical protein